MSVISWQLVIYRYVMNRNRTPIPCTPLLICHGVGDLNKYITDNIWVTLRHDLSRRMKTALAWPFIISLNIHDTWSLACDTVMWFFWISNTATYQYRGASERSDVNQLTIKVAGKTRKQWRGCENDKWDIHVIIFDTDNPLRLTKLSWRP